MKSVEIFKIIKDIEKFVGKENKIEYLENIERICLNDELFKNAIEEINDSVKEERIDAEFHRDSECNYCDGCDNCFLYWGKYGSNCFVSREKADQFIKMFKIYRKILKGENESF